MCDLPRSTVPHPNQIGALTAAVDEGRIMYDSAAARRCLDAVSGSCAAAVSGLSLGSAGCDMAFTGTVSEGGECYLDEECAPGLGCAFTGSVCPGTCTVGGTGGFLCGDAACSDGQQCFFPATGTARCVSEVLEPDAGEGQPCGLIEEGADALTRRACMAGLWCTGDGQSIGTCRAPIAAGAACASSDEVCVDGHVCAGGSCRAITLVQTPGGPCDEAMLQICDPLLRLECQSGACVRVGDGATGSPCQGGDFGALACNEGLVCHRDTASCGTPKPAGAACLAGAECASGSCDDEAGVCRDRYCEG